MTNPYSSSVNRDKSVYGVQSGTPEEVLVKEEGAGSTFNADSANADAATTESTTESTAEGDQPGETME